MKYRGFIITTFFLAQAISITCAEKTTTDAQKKLAAAVKSQAGGTPLAIRISRPSNEPFQPDQQYIEQGSPSITLPGTITESINHLSITAAISSSPSRSKPRSRSREVHPYYQDHRPPAIRTDREPVYIHSGHHDHPHNNNQSSNQSTFKKVAKLFCGAVCVAGVLTLIALLNPAPMPPSSCIINCTDSSFNVSNYNF